MAASPSVLVLDDGDLDDVRRVLQELGAEYAYVRGAAIPQNLELPSHGVAITTPRRAALLPDPPAAATAGARGARDGSPAAGERLVRIVVVGDESSALRDRLRQGGFDYLVRQPIHREALRLLLLRALYQGPERRSLTRLPVGYEVTFRAALRRRRADLAEISARGCRLLSSFPVREGRRIEVRIPTGLAAGEPFSLTGRVVRCQPEESGTEPAEMAIGVAFDELAEPVRRRLHQLLARCLVGPPTLVTSGDPWRAQRRWLRRLAGDDAEPAPAPAAGSGRPGAAADRRESPRRSYRQQVVATHRAADRVLLGRDLSRGGMRIEPDERIPVGTRLELALYGGPSEHPLIVRATASRDDGERGLALAFDPLGGDDAARLEHFVAGLPPVEPLQTSEPENLGLVFSEILPAS